jgi:5-oxoprolinase (ATP-hydrolysing) subunit A
MKFIDVNCDMGELPEAISGGTQEALMQSVSSINIACGGHAGHENTMRQTIEQAIRWKVAVGAHPGYPDRENFGRLEMDFPPESIANSVFEQIRALADVAASFRVQVTHVKPHGALYNQAARNPKIAQAIAAGVARWNRDIVLVGLAGSLMLEVFQAAGFRVAAEAFADRRYEPNGSLRARQFSDALIYDPLEAAGQALRIVESGTVIACGGNEIRIIAQTICIHSDTPGALQIAAAVANTLNQNGIAVRPFSRLPGTRA